MCAVEWKKLGDVCEVGTGSNNREDACDNGLYPFYVRSKDVLRINKYLFDEEAIIIPGEGGIGDIFHYANGKYGLHQRAYRVHPINDEVVCKYLYYYLSDKFKQYIVSKSVGATATSIRKPMLEGFMLPIPSLTKQQEIVSHLDTFTILISNLESELDMRRKQYEHYRNQLLDFEGVEGVEWKTLGDVCEIRGRIGFRGYTREDQVEEGEGVLSLSPGNIVNGKMDYNNSTYITWQKYEESPEIKTYDGDIIFCKTGSTVGKVSMVNKLPYKATINPQLVVLKEITINSKFLFYTLGTFRIQSLVKALAGVGSVPNISQAKLSEFKIHLPSTQTQAEIVSKLDAFENLIQSLEQEIKLRKQQYEYYREKLLTFE